MPSINELDSTIDYSRSNPAIDPTFFPNTVASYLLSASTYAFLMNGEWGVNFSGGIADYVNKGYGGQVRLVRAGQ